MNRNGREAIEAILRTEIAEYAEVSRESRDILWVSSEQCKILLCDLPASEP